MEIVFGFAERGLIESAKIDGYLPSDRFDDILVLCMGLDIGDIKKSLIGDSRKQIMKESFFSDEWTVPDNQDFLICWEKIESGFEAFHKMAKQGVPARIWYSDTPNSLCGYIYTVAQLSKYNCKISAVHLPRYSDGNSLTPLIEWTDISPESLSNFLKFEREVDMDEQKTISALWEKLKADNAPLRAYVNGYVIGVPENFYDSLIISEMGCSPFEVADIILGMFKDFPLGISDYIIAKRLKEMIRLGILKVCDKKPRFYNSILQKT